MNNANNLARRTKIGPQVVLVAVVLAGICFASGGYGQQMVVVAPAPVVAVVVPVPFISLFGGDYDGRRDARDYGRRGHESRAVAHGVRGHEGKR